jgi:hypothetical protein
VVFVMYGMVLLAIFFSVGAAALKDARLARAGKNRAGQE